jgi:photosystem II stability/assembly factor-like uncharacterized protein
MSTSSHRVAALVTFLVLAASSTIGLTARGSASSTGRTASPVSTPPVLAARGAATSSAWIQVSEKSIVHEIVADPSDKRRYFAATTSGAMRSDDGGRHWSIHIVGLPSGDPALWTILPAGDGHTLVAGGDAPAVYLSNDEGLSWRAQPQELGAGGIYALSEDPAAQGLLLAGTSDGIWRSSDAGAHWVHAYGTKAASASGFTWTGGTVYAGLIPGPRQIVASHDLGKTWRDATAGFAGDEGIMALAAAGGLNATVLAGTMGHRVWRYDTQSQEWAESAAGLPPASHGASLLSVPGQTWVGTIGNGVYTSRDGGRTWSPYGPALPRYAGIVLSLAVSGSDLLAGTAQGIYRLPGAIDG